MRLHELTPGVVLPAAQAGVTGILSAGLAGTLAWLFNLPVAEIVAVVFTGTTTAFWLAGLTKWNAKTAIENWTGWDIDNDGVVGTEPEPVAAEPVRVTTTTPDGRQTRFHDGPAWLENAVFAEFARGVLDGRAISFRNWTGKGAMFTQTQFSELREWLTAQNWIEQSSDKDERRGCQLTAVGRDVFTRYAAAGGAQAGARAASPPHRWVTNEFSVEMPEITHTHTYIHPPERWVPVYNRDLLLAILCVLVFVIAVTGGALSWLTYSP